MLSTVEQFRVNCPALAGTEQSDITDDQIINIIELADLHVKIDIGNIYAQSVIVASTKAFNLLSQYKSAELGLSEFYGYGSRNTPDDVQSWSDKYDSLVSKIIKSTTIYDQYGNRVPRTSKTGYSKQECTEIETYSETDNILEV